MSDSEDDFMSDKFLTEAPAQEKTYTARRSTQQLKSMRKGHAKNMATLREIEESRRREGLNKSLFDDIPSGSASPSGSAGPSAPSGTGVDAGKSKAMDLMMKMGWKVGEGLGRRRSASPERKDGSGAAPRERDDDAPRGGIGSAARMAKQEPIRISMWAGRKGLAARSPSPPPLRSRTDPDYLPEARLEQLAKEAESFRGQRGADEKHRDAQRKAAKARELLVQYDAERGVKFHPLHAQPEHPEALPRPLRDLIYPADASRSPSPVLEAAPRADPTVSTGARFGKALNMNAAERLRAQMRREMLSEIGAQGEEEDGEDIKFGVPAVDKEGVADVEEKEEGEEPDWAELVSGTKRVLAMTAEEHLAYLVSQLRDEHRFCFWCAYKYPSFEEMDGPGGCPGEEEDDH